MSPSGFPFLVYFINLNSSTLFWILKHSGVIFETLAQKSFSASQPQSCKKARLETRMKLTHIPCTIVFKATLGWRSCLSAALSPHQTGQASSHRSSGERSQGHYRPHITLQGNVLRDNTDHTSREKPYVSFMATAPSQKYPLASAEVLSGFRPKLGLLSHCSTPIPSAVKLNRSPTLRDVMKIKQHKFCP